MKCRGKQNGDETFEANFAKSRHERLFLYFQLQQKRSIMEEKTIAGPYCPPSIGMLLIIVGTRFYTPAKELEGYLSEAPKHKMKLEAEPYNKFDPLAVKVLDCQGEERLIGYIRSEDTRKAHF